MVEDQGAASLRRVKSLGRVGTCSLQSVLTAQCSDTQGPDNARTLRRYDHLIGHNIPCHVEEWREKTAQLIELMRCPC